MLFRVHSSPPALLSYSLKRVSWFCKDERTLEKCCIDSYSNVFASFVSVIGNNHPCTVPTSIKPLFYEWYAINCAINQGHNQDCDCTHLCDTSLKAYPSPWLSLCRAWPWPGSCLTFLLLTPPVSPVSTVSLRPAHLAELDSLKSCSQGPGGALWDTSSRLQLPQSRPVGLKFGASTAVQWFWRPSMTTATGGMMDGRSASGRENGLFSWKRLMLTGGRWDKGSSFLSLSFILDWGKSSNLLDFDFVSCQPIPDNSYA